MCSPPKQTRPVCTDTHLTVSSEFWFDCSVLCQKVLIALTITHCQKNVENYELSHKFAIISQEAGVFALQDIHFLNAFYTLTVLICCCTVLLLLPSQIKKYIFLCILRQNIYKKYYLHKS